MIYVNTGATNWIEFVPRYNQIHKWEIMDHNSRIVESGTTLESGSGITAIDGKIYLTGLTYGFSKNEQYTFKAYYLYSGTYYLATHQLLRSWTDIERVDNYVKPIKTTKTFKVYKK